jgi:hypothetical protein
MVARAGGVLEAAGRCLLDAQEKEVGSQPSYASRGCAVKTQSRLGRRRRDATDDGASRWMHELSSAEAAMWIPVYGGARAVDTSRRRMIVCGYGRWVNGKSTERSVQEDV